MGKFKGNTSLQEAPTDSGPVLARQTGEVLSGTGVSRTRPGRRGRRSQRPVDVTVLKELERFRNELLSSISQEMRNPLISIKGSASTLLQSGLNLTEEQRKELLEYIEEESDHLSHVVAGLLDVSRLESGALKLDKKECRVSEIINSIADKLDMINRHHPVKQNISPRLPPVYVDQRRIAQVILNLVQNAAKYSREGRPISIEAKYYRQQVIICVIDKGVGIPAQLQDKVFDRFYQVENIMAGYQSRNDIGLSICRGIVEAHSGKIWVESKVGEGSQFCFTLPIKNEDSENRQSV